MRGFGTHQDRDLALAIEIAGQGDQGHCKINRLV